SNPALQCFVRLLLEDMNKDLKDDFTNEQENKSHNLSSMKLVKIDETVSSKTQEVRNKHVRARNRWHLFATMTMNPSIIRYRTRYLDVDSSLLPDYTHVDEKLNKKDNNHLSPINNNFTPGKIKDSSANNGNGDLQPERLRQRQAKSVIGQLNQGCDENMVFF
uniref:Uncharacterized protein n=2 Tax=Clytia hemisphaerica TaxID=252671 RepID=A0A7M5UQH0_9CNID